MNNWQVRKRGANMAGFCMYWVNEKTRRYYHAAVVRDLFGGLVVVRATGSKDTRRGRVMSYPVRSPGEAAEMLEQVGRDRDRHGYTQAGV